MYKHVYNVNRFNTLSKHQWKALLFFSPLAGSDKGGRESPSGEVEWERLFDVLILFYIRGEKSEDTAVQAAEPPAEREARRATHFKAPIETERF